MNGLRCKPGDLAIVVRFPLAPSIIGKPVQLTSEPPFYISSEAFWSVAGLATVVYERDCLDARRKKITSGVIHKIRAIADGCLRPIRPQSEDDVDEVLRLVGAPNYGEVTS